MNTETHTHTYTIAANVAQAVQILQGIRTALHEWGMEWRIDRHMERCAAHRSRRRRRG